MNNMLEFVKENYKPTRINIFEEEYNIGKVIIETVLQPGLNYNSVVFPRVQRFKKRYSSFYKLSDFELLLELEGPEELLGVNNKRKTRSLYDLVRFLKEEHIEYIFQLKDLIVSKTFKQKLNDVFGIGKKSMDYMLILLDLDTFAIDRHLFNFVNQFQTIHSYDLVQQNLQDVADKLGLSYKSLDYYIWSYMSTNRK